MQFLDGIERRLHRFAIPHLGLLLSGGMATMLVLDFLAKQNVVPSSPILSCLLIPERVINNHEWWRLLSFVFVPPFNAGTVPHLALYLFCLYCFNSLVQSVESVIGTFRLNVYVLIAAAASVVTAFVLSSWLRMGGAVFSSVWIYSSIIVAIYHLFPDARFYIFFILPIKARWLGLAHWTAIAISLIFGGTVARVLLLVSHVNFFIFFGPEVLRWVRERIRRNRHAAAIRTASTAVEHSCAECGITGRRDPHMEFRYCSSCTKGQEYCEIHLRNHVHS